MNDADSIQSIGMSAIKAPTMSKAYNTTCVIRRRVRAESARPKLAAAPPTAPGR
jgi:hypothetical protein